MLKVTNNWSGRDVHKEMVLLKRGKYDTYQVKKEHVCNKPSLCPSAKT